MSCGWGIYAALSIPPELCQNTCVHLSQGEGDGEGEGEEGDEEETPTEEAARKKRKKGRPSKGGAGKLKGKVCRRSNQSCVSIAILCSYSS